MARHLASLLSDLPCLQQRTATSLSARELTAQRLAPPQPNDNNNSHTDNNNNNNNTTNNDSNETNSTSTSIKYRLVPLNDALRDGIPHGIGVHNADLTAGEREIVEAAVKQKKKKVLKSK
jgi:hypothetical protein